MSKVEVRSYIQVGDNFVPIGQFAGPLEDQYYVEGALELTIDGKMISNLRYFDLIDQLWAYIVQCLEKVVAGQKAETYWPDQPIRLSMTPLPNNKLMIERSGTSDPDVKVVADKLDVIDGLLAGAFEFFRAFAPLCSGWNPVETLASLDALELWRLKTATVQPYG